MTDNKKGIISWFTVNPVAANLLMLCIVVVGSVTAMNIKKEFFPEFSIDTVHIDVEYPGAAPKEVEQGICVKIEEVIQNIDGIKEIYSTAFEGLASFDVQVKNGFDVKEIREKLKSAIDAVGTLPDGAEKPSVFEVIIREGVLWIILSGDMDAKSLKIMAEKIKEEMLLLPDISRIDIVGTKDYEISIEVSEKSLRKYGLTFDHIVEAVGRSSLDLPSGSIKTKGGEILLRTENKAYTIPEFEKIVLLTYVDGIRVTLGDVANIVDGFEEKDWFLKSRGKDAVGLQIFRVGNQSALKVAEAARAYIEKKRPDLPDNVFISSVADTSVMLKDRLNMMIKNMLLGALLVFLSLFLFLRFKIAFWVMAGLPVCFLGTIMLMPTPMVDVSINMITLYGFILVLGIVVDDAIVIGENIDKTVCEEGAGADSVIKGARQVAMPATFGVLTTAAAFIPILMIPGINGKIWRGIGIIVLLCLFFSLIESKFILPSHLTHMGTKNRSVQGEGKSWIQNRVTRGMAWFINHVYKPCLEVSLLNRYTTLAVFMGVLILTLGLIKTGMVRFVFFPEIESDTIEIELTMAGGTPFHYIEAGIKKIEQAAEAVNEELKKEYDLSKEVIKHIISYSTSETCVEFYVELIPNEERPVGSGEVTKRWRKKTGTIIGAVELDFKDSMADVGSPVDFQLEGNDFKTLKAAADALKEELSRHGGVFDIKDSFVEGKREIRLVLKPGAENSGIFMSNLARQVRQGFYGVEAQQIHRGRDEVKVMIRYPRAERSSLGDLENMRLRTSEGKALPFSSVAKAVFGRSFLEITRVNRKRIVNVTADVDKASIEPQKIIQDIEEKFMPILRAKYPGVRYNMAGESLEEKDTLRALQKGTLLAIFVIFAMMAVPLKSYLQPFVIMSAVPFGAVGAVIGHLLIGMPVSILSLCGIIALSGVVVNDSLVMVDFINKRCEQGMSVFDAVKNAGPARFRAIFLTSITTFLGLLPMLLEKSLQAQFLIPMAVSLAFGILFATFVTLFLIPTLYLVGADMKAFFGRKPIARVHVGANT